MARAAQRKERVQQHPPSPEDQADTAALEASVSMMIGVLEAWDYSRPLSSLNRADLSKIAVAAISGFIIERSKHEQIVWWDELNIGALTVG